MALTPEQVAGFRAAAEQIAQPVIEWLLQDIARRVAEAGRMTSTAAYEAYRAQALGESRRALTAFLKKQLKISESEAAFLLQEAAQFAQADDYARVGVWAAEADRTSLARLTGAAVRQAGIELQNLTGTLGMTSPRTGRPQPLQRVYRECMDEAMKLVSTGAASATQAARQATRSLAGRGVVSIDYASGVSTELSAAVRRNLMGGMGQLVEQVTRMDHDDLGCDGWEISAHANSAPDHEPIQGRQYSDAEYERLNAGLARRIGTLNCGHVAMPVILGVDSPQYTEAELEAFREENARGVTWEGRQMTGYEATQYQNRIERSIRTQKYRALMSEAAGDEEQLLHDRIRLTRLHQEYARFNKAMGFKSRAERLEVVGWGRRQAAKTARRLHNAGKGDILSENADDYIPITEQSIEAVQPFECSVLDTAGQKVLAQAHQQLLREASQQPLGVEVSRCLDLNGAPIGEIIVGKDGRVRIPNQNVPYIAAHTHPSGLTFSPGDIRNFANHENMRMLTAVGNNGTVYAVEKLQNFKRKEVLNVFVNAEETLSKSENVQQLVESMEKLLKEAEQYGVSYHTGKNTGT